MKRSEERVQKPVPRKECNEILNIPQWIGWNACNNRMRRNILYYHRTSTHNHPFANDDSLPHGRPSSNMYTFANLDSASQFSSSRHMDVITQYAIMLYNCATVNNYIGTQYGPSINNTSGKKL